MHQTAGRHARRDPGARSARSRARRARGDQRSTGAPALADDRVPHAQGLDRARNSSTASRSRAPGARIRCRSPISRTPNTCNSSKTGCRAIGRTNCSTNAASSARNSPQLAPTGHRRMGSNPHANGGELLVPLSMPHFRDYAVDGARTRQRAGRGDARSGHVPARRDEAQSRQQNFRLFGPDETASNRLEAVYRGLRQGMDGGRSKTSTSISAPTAGSWRC